MSDWNEAYKRAVHCSVGEHDGHPEGVVQKDSAWQAFEDRCALAVHIRSQSADIKRLRGELEAERKKRQELADKNVEMAYLIDDELKPAVEKLRQERDAFKSGMDKWAADCADESDRADKAEARAAALRQAVDLAIGFCVNARETWPDWQDHQEIGVLFARLTATKQAAPPPSPRSESK